VCNICFEDGVFLRGYIYPVIYRRERADLFLERGRVGELFLEGGREKGRERKGGRKKGSE